MLVHALVVFSAFFSGLFGVVSYSSVTVAGSSTSTSAAFMGLVLRGVMGCQVTKRTVTTWTFGTLRVCLFEERDRMERFYSYF